jgi:hypothetical protein
VEPVEAGWRDQLRDLGGEGGGQWVKVRSLLDKVLNGQNGPPVPARAHASLGETVAAAKLNRGESLDLADPTEAALQDGISAWSHDNRIFGQEIRDAVAADPQTTTRGGVFMRAVAAAPPDAPVLYRGIRDMPVDQVPKKGAQIDLGLTSFSRSRDVADQFALGFLGEGSDNPYPPKPTGARVHITVKAGSRALRIDQAAGDLGFGQEHVAMGRYRVVGRTQKQVTEPWGPKQSPRTFTVVELQLEQMPAVTANREANMANLDGVELARPGTWNLASGPITVTPRMLDDAARFAAREGARPGYLKIGHTDKRFMAGDGEPALGWLHNIRLEEDDQGDVLKGDLRDLPDWLATAIPRHWPDRSIEGYADYDDDGQKYGLVVDGLALLGVTPPGMSSIKSLRDLPVALGVAASVGARRIVASFGGTSTSAPEAVGSPTNKGALVDPVKIREALGLNADASDDDVREAFGNELSPPDRTVPVAAAAPGTVVLASSVWEENLKTIQTLSQFVEQTKRNERDEVIAKAIQAGKFTPAQRKQFSEAWDANPDVTRNLIQVMTPNSALAVQASGYAGEGVEADAEYSALFGNSAKVG